MRYMHNRRILAFMAALVMLAGIMLPARITADEGNPAGTGTVTMTDWIPSGTSPITDYEIKLSSDAVISFEEKTPGVSTAVVISSGTVQLANAVNVNATAERIIVNGDATVILAGVNTVATDGPAMKIVSPYSATVQLAEGTTNQLTGAEYYAGLEVGWAGSDSFASLTLTGSGTLYATGGNKSAGIGASQSNKNAAGKTIACYNGNITINADGGTIYATGNDGAGIGSANNNRHAEDGSSTTSASYKMTRTNATGELPEWGSITINDGIIHASSNGGGAGIGGGNHVDSGKVTISGGTIYAHGGGGGGAGIGCGIGSQKQENNFTKGPGHYFADVTINGGNITADSGWLGAGIGGGYSCDAKITINGGVINATGGNGNSGANYQGGPGVGAGYMGIPQLTINGGKITAKGGTGAPGIGYGPGALEGNTSKDRGREATYTYDQSYIIINDGVIDARGGINGAGIGGGNGNQHLHITISGGTITARGYSDPDNLQFGGAGIGSGTGLTGGATKYKSDTELDVTITGGTITAIGGWGASGIGSGSCNKIAASISISGGDIQAYADGTKFAIDTRVLHDDGSTTSYATGRSISVPVLQGTYVHAYTVDGMQQNPEGLSSFSVINDQTGSERTLTGMPAGYRSFAATVSSSGTYTVYTTADSIGEGGGRYFSETAKDVYNEDEILNVGVQYQVTGNTLSDNFYLFPVKTIAVEKQVVGLRNTDLSGLNMTVSFALKSKSTGDYIRDKAGNIFSKEIKIVDGVPSGMVYFVNVPEGKYDILEMNGDNPMSAGSVFSSYTLKRISTRDSSGGTTNDAVISAEKWTDNVVVVNEFDKPTTVTITKKVSGEIWLVECDVMEDSETSGSGEAWKTDVISNPQGDPSLEGHSSRLCGSADHWVIWVDAEGHPFRLDEVSGAAGETQAAVVYEPQFELTDAEIRSLSAESDTILLNKYTANFSVPTTWDTVKPGERIYWTTQTTENGETRVYHHTGRIYRADPEFTLLVNGKQYDLKPGESVTLEDLYDDILQIEESADGKYRLGGVTVNGNSVTPSGEWTAGIALEGAETAAVDWINEPNPPDLPDPPSPPGPPPKQEYVVLSIRKVWNDEDDNDGIRPESIRVVLRQDGEPYLTAELNAENNWNYTTQELPKLKGKYLTEAIEYEWEEPDVAEGYTMTSEGPDSSLLTTLTNSHEPEKTELSVRKVWEDAENRDGIRPESITVRLMAGENQIGEVTLSAENEWTASVGNLPVYAGGQKITYTWEEQENIPGYTLTGTTTENNLTILTNTYRTPEPTPTPAEELIPTPTPESIPTPTPEPTPEPTAEPEVTELAVRKVWNDAENQDGIRPASIRVRLIADGAEIGNVLLSEANGWTATIADLPVYANGQTVAYHWEEGNVPGYTSQIGINGNLTTFTNTHVPEVTELTVRKVWDDAGNAQNRPASVRMTLSNGQSVTLDEASEWTATIDNLPVYYNGEAIEYTWTEQEIAGYTLVSRETVGNTTVFTNRAVTIPDIPEGNRQPHIPTKMMLMDITDYDTALGLAVMNSQVGDCFD